MYAALLQKAGACGPCLQGALRRPWCVARRGPAVHAPFTIPNRLAGADRQRRSGQSLLSAGRAAVTAFLVGAVGMVLGALLSFYLVSSQMGPEGSKLAACLCASYIGGSVNFAAVAKAVGLSPGVMSAAVAIDNAAMAIYLAALMAVPADVTAAEPTGNTSTQPPPRPVTAESVAMALCAAAVACMLGHRLAAQLAMPSITLLITALAASTVAMAAVKTGHAGAFAGASQLGGAIMMLFFAMVGAGAGSLPAVLGQAPAMLLFIAVMCSVHAAFLVTVGRTLHLPWRVLIIGSNANVGGPATAAGMAAAKGWHDLLQPAMVTGSLGYAIGTAAGLLVARLLGGA